MNLINGTTGQKSRVSRRLLKLVNHAIDSAQNSELNIRHGAVLFTGQNIMYSSCNCHGSKIWGYDVPSHHAEAGCLRPLVVKRSKKRRRKKGFEE